MMISKIQTIPHSKSCLEIKMNDAHVCSAFRNPPKRKPVEEGLGPGDAIPIFANIFCEFANFGNFCEILKIA